MLTILFPGLPNEAHLHSSNQPYQPVYASQKTRHLKSRRRYLASLRHGSIKVIGRMLMMMMMTMEEGGIAVYKTVGSANMIYQFTLSLLTALLFSLNFNSNRPDPLISLASINNVIPLPAYLPRRPHFLRIPSLLLARRPPHRSQPPHSPSILPRPLPNPCSPPLHRRRQHRHSPRPPIGVLHIRQRTHRHRPCRCLLFTTLPAHRRLAAASVLQAMCRARGSRGRCTCGLGGR
jgi:hypothetical protein